jgi:hypothetical protein
VEAVSARDGWAAQRDEFRSRLRAEEDRLLLQLLAGQEVRERVLCFTAAMRGLELISETLKDDSRTPAEIGTLMKALKTCQEVAESAVTGKG